MQAQATGGEFHRLFPTRVNVLLPVAVILISGNHLSNNHQGILLQMVNIKKPPIFIYTSNEKGNLKFKTQCTLLIQNETFRYKTSEIHAIYMKYIKGKLSGEVSYIHTQEDQHCQDVSLFPVDCRLHEISIKIPENYSIGIDKLTLQLIWRGRIANSILNEKNKVERLMLLDLTWSYSIATITKRVWYCRKKKKKD